MRQRLLDLKQTTAALQQLNSDDITLEQSMARYLTVRSAGYVEAIRDDVADLYTSVRSPIEVTRRVRVHLRTGQGAAPDQLTKFVASFSPEWSESLIDYLDRDDSALRSALGAMVAARKKIAHGDGESVTVSRALTWAKSAEQIGNWLIQTFNPN
jgi:hypothetical protein